MRRWPSLLIAIVVCAGGSVAQQKPSVSELASRSGIIFRGTVLAVVGEGAIGPGSLGTTRVSFLVDESVRGSTTGETITIRQWNVGDDEYRTGEALVLFLYPPSDEIGLTSPVGGHAGHLRQEDVSSEELESLRTESKPAHTPSVTIPPQPIRPQRRSAQ